jgi:hypothetical protein
MSLVALAFNSLVPPQHVAHRVMQFLLAQPCHSGPATGVLVFSANIYPLSPTPTQQLPVKALEHAH